MWQAGALFGVDMFTNVTDYIFHIYLGWALAPGDFAVVQTMNSILLIAVTAFAVLQPVVARFVAADEQGAAGRRSRAALSPRSRTVFQRYFRQGIVIGLALCLFFLLLRAPFSSWLNVPAAAYSAGMIMMVLILLRPVVLGVLQGGQRFIAFGVTRASYAVSRLLLAILLITILGGGALAGVLSLPLGGLLALGVGLVLLGKDIWRKGEPLPPEMVRGGWRLSLAALLAYTAFMGLQNFDLIWVNRQFPAVTAGSYATAIVLRRVLAVLPGVVLVIFYPRVVAQVSRSEVPDRIILKASAAIMGITAVLIAGYFILGTWLVDLMFGQAYAEAGPLLGWMGVGMMAYGLAAIWLNLFLATRPWPYVVVLSAVALAQLVLLTAFHETVWQVISIFVASGWLVALAGLALYMLWLRPQLKISKNLSFALERSP